MTTTVNCILCSSLDAKLLEVVNGATINNLYKKAFNISHALNAKELSLYHCEACDLNFFLPLETGGEELYESLQLFDWYYLTEKQEYCFAKEYLNENSNVLEVGAGKAAFSSLVGTKNYTGLEFNDLAIKSAKMHGVHLIKESVEKHATRSEKYDAVVSFQVLEHVGTPFSFIKSCLDCLKPGGVLVLAVPSKDGFNSKINNHILDMPPHHVTKWSEQTLRYITSIFPVECVAIEHEKISEQHKSIAKKAYLEDKLRRLCSCRKSIIDTSLLSKLISKISELFSKVFPLALLNDKGHTVLAVYRKK